MPWDGGGNFNRAFGATGWVDDRNSTTFILATRHDTHDQDIATGLNLAITKDNQSKPAADFKANADNAYDMGAVALTWKNIYARALRLVNSGFYASIVPSTLTVNRAITLPDADGTILLDSNSSIKTGYSVRKLITTSRQGTTLADDPELVKTLTAGYYAFRIHLFFDCDVTTVRGFKWMLALSASTDAGHYYEVNHINGAANCAGYIGANGVILSYPIVQISGGTTDSTLVQGYFTVPGGAIVSIQWAQNSIGSPTNTNLRAGSYLLLERVA